MVLTWAKPNQSSTAPRPAWLSYRTGKCLSTAPALFRPPMARPETQKALSFAEPSKKQSLELRKMGKGTGYFQNRAKCAMTVIGLDKRLPTFHETWSIACGSPLSQCFLAARFLNSKDSLSYSLLKVWCEAWTAPPSRQAPCGDGICLCKSIQSNSMAKATQASRPEYEYSHTTLDASHYYIGFHVAMGKPHKQMLQRPARGRPVQQNPPAKISCKA